MVSRRGSWNRTCSRSLQGSSWPGSTGRVCGLQSQRQHAPANDEVTIELKGELAGILALADGAKISAESPQDRALQIKMVAGARSHLYRTDIRIPVDCVSNPAHPR